MRQRTGQSQAQLAGGIGLTQDKISRRQPGAQSWTLDKVDARALHRLASRRAERALHRQVRCALQRLAADPRHQALRDSTR
ncbi:hypothetical protein [Kitasatospora griseola]|uniref:hypothetical protein n=1 Tax=Kitasatospora griseola TaxID=2064 RepID=UPI00365C160A